MDGRCRKDAERFRAPARIVFTSSSSEHRDGHIVLAAADLVVGAPFIGVGTLSVNPLSSSG